MLNELSWNDLLQEYLSGQHEREQDIILTEDRPTWLQELQKFDEQQTVEDRDGHESDSQILYGTAPGLCVHLSKYW